MTFLKDYKKPPFGKSRQAKPIVKPLLRQWHLLQQLQGHTYIHFSQRWHIPRLLQHVTGRLSPSFLSIVGGLAYLDLIHCLLALKFLHLEEDLPPHTHRKLLPSHF
jgi:hypothetical protein